MRILLIEDDLVFADGLRMGLGLLGFAVEAVGTCADGQASIIGGEFDAIVLDVVLPYDSGLDLLAELRASGNLTPVVICTALESFQDNMRWLKAGADACVGKPIDLDELGALLVNLCQQPSGDVYLSSKSRSTSPPLTVSSGGSRECAARKIEKLRRIAARATVSLLVLSILVGSRTALSEELRLPFSSEQRQAIGEVVKEYLLQNPEVLRDASVELERRSDQLQKDNQAKALKKYWSQLISPRGSTIIGNPNGRINLVAFFDYNCPFCRASVDDIQKLIDDNPELRVVLREFPILGQDSADTSRIALAVAQESSDRALRARYYTSLMKTKGQMNGMLALSVATELGLDAARLKSDLKDTDIDAILRENYSFAEALGITGTPAFVIGDQVIVGAVGPERMQAAISTVLK